MWEKQAGDVPGGQLHPWKEQRKRAQDMGEDASALLFVQLVLCVMIALVVFFAKMSQVPFFTDMRQQYQEMISYGVEFSSDNPMIRFATGGVDALREQAQKVLDELQAYEPEALTGSGGFWPVKSREVPDGASVERYVSAEELTMPVTGVFTSGFGFRENPVTGEDDFHAGVDLAAAQGTPVKSALNGQVLKTGYTDSRGSYILVRHDNGVQTLYQHLSFAAVRQGQAVKAGEVIGMVGSTGLSTGPHLHFELRVNGVCVDPAPSLPELQKE